MTNTLLHSIAKLRSPQSLKLRRRVGNRITHTVCRRFAIIHTRSLAEPIAQAARYRRRPLKRFGVSRRSRLASLAVSHLTETLGADHPDTRRAEALRAAGAAG